jgi:hypothetical protein
MNLIQIQEHLKDMPTQAIMGYANGQNPMVPPYLALSEMNRRKQMEKRAAEPPQQSVKEQLEQELMQPQGITQGMPQMPQQGMPQGAPQMPPQGMRPPMPQQAPPQAPQMAPQGMAGGGLTNLPMRSDRFNYAPGGIVAFADEGLVQLPEQEAADIMRKQLKGEIDLPMPQSREQERAALIAKDPTMAAYLNKAPGEAMTGLMGTLKGQNEAQKRQFEERQSSQGLGTLANALMAAAEGTRGRKGSGLGEAFIGFGKTYTAAQDEEYKRQQEQAAIERAQTIEMAKLQSDVDNMQRAFAEGRVEDGMKYKAAIEARKGKIAELQGLRAKDVMSLADKQRDDAERARHNKEMEKLQGRQASAAERTANKPSAFAEQMAAIKNNPDAFRIYQGQGKSGVLTYEEAIKQVNSQRINAGMPEDQKAALAAEMVRQSIAVMSGQPLPPVVKPPEDTRSPYERIMPSMLGGKPAPTKTTAVPFSQLPK